MAKFTAPPKPKTADDFVAGAPSVAQPQPGDSELVSVNLKITKGQHEALRRIAFDRSLRLNQRASQAELVREAIDMYLKKNGAAK